jgi:hypothetical protein
MRIKLLLVGIFIAFLLVSGIAPQAASSCGGLFCQNNPVDQNAERIIFTQNGDGTVSAIIQIQYTGFDDDFSWILPLSTPITAEDIEVPETGTAAFLELEQLTNVRIIAPPVPDDCEQIVFESAMPSSAEGGGVEVFASGEVGPFGFDVIGSDDPSALIIWLRDNNYRVEEQMEPLINVYVEENFYFLAMRLLPEQGVQDIQPIKITYDSDVPMIPLRLTAVAANPDMAVLTWFFGSAQAVPTNYAQMEVPNDELRFFFPFGGNNYRQLMGEKANSFNGQAFITEYAGPSNTLGFTDPLLVDLAQKHPYLTRLNTVISPEEMTVDPVFGYDTARADVSNVRDLSASEKDLYICDRGDGVATSFEESESSGGFINIPFIGGGNNDNTSSSGSGESSGRSGAMTGFIIIMALIVITGAVVAILGGVWLLQRSRK